MASTILWFDDTNVALLPAGYTAYAAYINGLFDNLAAVKARFPKAEILSIDVNGSNTTANCLDIENGDATNAIARTWVHAKIAAKAKLIVVYTSVSNVNALVAELTAAGIPRGAYKIWTAHYGAGAHICGPATCGLCSYAANATQFTDKAFGDSLDETLADGNFFGVIQVPVTTDPLLIQGDTGDSVRKLQTRLNVWGLKLLVDGIFAGETETAIRTFQTQHKLTVDGVVGPATWAVLNSSPPPPKPPAPAPYAAPGHVGEDFTHYPLRWNPVVVSGKQLNDYNVKVVDTATSKRLTNATVTGTSVILSSLTEARHYDVYVAAIGGPTAFGYAAHIQIIA